MTNKIVGILKLPKKFAKTYSNELYSWITKYNSQGYILRKDENNIHFKAETNSIIAEFVYDFLPLNDGSEWKRIVTLLDSQDIIPDIYILGYNTCSHTATRYSFELHPRAICNEFILCSERQIQLSNYLLYIYGFEATINAQTVTGITCISKALNIPHTKLDTAIQELEITYIPIWKLFDDKESQLLKKKLIDSYQIETYSIPPSA